MTNAEKERILAKTLEKIEEIEKSGNLEKNARGIEMKREKMNNGKVLKFTLGKGGKVLAASMAAVLIIGGTSYAAIQLAPSIRNYFGIQTESQNEIAQKITSLEDVESTSNGITAKIHQVTADKNGFLTEIVLSGFKNAIPYDFDFSDATFEVEGVDSEDITYTTDTRINGIHEDTHSVHVLFSVKHDILSESNENLDGRNIKLKLNDLVIADASGNETTFQEGSWELGWKLSVNALTINKDVDKEIDIHGSKVIWKSIELSPISLSCYFTAKEDGPVYGSEHENDEEDRIVVTLLDGRKIDSRFTDDLHVYWNDRYVVGFTEILDLNQVESITFNGETLVLRENPNKVAFKKFVSEAGNFSLELPEDFAKYFTMKEVMNETNEELGCKQDTVSFIANKDGLEKSVFTIYRLKTDSIDGIGTEDGDPFLNLIAQGGHEQYAIKYSELYSEEEIDVYADFLNQYQGFILPGFELLK